ncbi:MAG: UDP-N-acetylmuramoyl-L-alanine--D-glutamate ligase [Spirulinaceae cyanobacterium SM2_1_0]|nr:UDP-N-acetylmuramoyl-L-alanine--D-glutamate ligase [Spirulinaceae cyanobacterium SM2_1_0]
MPRAQIVGLGRSGVAAARLLQQAGWHVELSDRNDTATLQTLAQSLRTAGIMVKLGYSLVLSPGCEPDAIIVSPGVPWDLPVLVAARDRGIDTLGEMELAWRHLQTVPWVAITGTNGKTTTTALTAAMFQAAGLQAPACGNIGYAACELAIQQHPPQPPVYDWIVAEISSYQIESSRELAPQIGIWTTFSPDHLQRHYTLENYQAIKASLLQRSRQQIFNGDDPHLRQAGCATWPDAYWTSVQGRENLLVPPERGVYIEAGQIVAFGEAIAPVASLRMLGVHNQQNLLLAVGAARLAGIDAEAIARAIAAFPGVPHRLELVAVEQGIEFVNDSKATNYDAAQVGLAAVPPGAILIAGGEAKAGDDRQWLATIRQRAAAVMLIGAAAPTFAQALDRAGYSDWEILETLDEAVPRSLTRAHELGAKTVLFSPACASFDQYQSFEQRGEHFRRLCRQLASDG